MTGASEPVSHPNQLSGWLLPTGEWHPCEDWWHLTALYDLRDAGLAELSSPVAHEILGRGREEEIRDFVAGAGFVRISRSLIDGHALTHRQLLTLQGLVEFCEPNTEIEVLDSKRGVSVRMTIARILKFRSPLHFFDEVDRL